MKINIIHKCRKIHGLCCVNPACTRARDTQPSPCIFLHICRGSYLLLRKRASILWPKIKGQSARKVPPAAFILRTPPPLRHLSQGIFHGQLSHLTVRWTLGMKSEPPFKTARSFARNRLPCHASGVALAHDADVNCECHALLETTVFLPNSHPASLSKTWVLCACMFVCTYIGMWRESGRPRSGVDALLARSGQKLARWFVPLNSSAVIFWMTARNAAPM